MTVELPALAESFRGWLQTADRIATLAEHFAEQSNDPAKRAAVQRAKDALAELHAAVDQWR